MSEEDYSPVGSPDEDEEKRRRLAEAYPAPAPLAAPAPLGSTEDLEARAAQPRVMAQPPAPAPVSAPAPRPEWKDYAPAERHGWAKFGSMLAGINPVANRIVNLAPQQRAEQNYTAAASEYDKEQAQKLATEKQTSETGLQSAQAEEAQARTEAINHPQPKPKEEEWSVIPSMTGENGEIVQQEKTSGKVRLVPGVSGVKPLKETGAEFDSFYQQWLKDNKFPDTSHNRLMAKAEFDRAEHATQIRGQDMTDARAREFNQNARDTKAEQAKDKGETQLASFDADLDRLATAANELKTHPGLNSITGLRGAIPNIPGTAAADAAAKLHTLKSQVAFGVLQNMRNNSKTGGALGAVSDKEGQLLQDNLAALDQSQSAEAMAKSLDAIIQYANGAKQRAREAFQRTQTTGGAEKSSGAEPSRPANVPANYIHKDNGPKGPGWYKPTAP